MLRRHNIHSAIHTHAISLLCGSCCITCTICMETHSHTHETPNMAKLKLICMKLLANEGAECEQHTSNETENTSKQLFKILKECYLYLLAISLWTTPFSLHTPSLIAIPPSPALCVHFAFKYFTLYHRVELSNHWNGSAVVVSMHTGIRKDIWYW